MLARVIVMSVIGQVTDSRLDSLRGCHALHERKAVRTFTHGSRADMDKAIGDAVRELVMANRVRALDGKLTFLVTVEV